VGTDSRDLWIMLVSFIQCVSQAIGGLSRANAHRTCQLRSNWHNPRLVRLYCSVVDNLGGLRDMMSSCFHNHLQKNLGHIPAFLSCSQPNR